MRRYYLSKIVGDGSIEDPYRHRLQELIDTASEADFIGGEIAVDGTTGQPLHPAILCMVSATNHSAFVADSGLIPLPHVPLDSAAGGIAPGVRSGVKARLVAELGYGQAAVDAVWEGGTSFAAVLDHYGQLNNSSFSAVAFDLTDL